MNNNSKTFTGVQVAKANINLAQNSLVYDIYKVSHLDSEFLKQLQKKINLKELWNGLTFIDYMQWQYILDKALTFKNSEKNFGYLLTTNNRPCGILNCIESVKNYHVDYVSTWPLENNKKLPLAGKVLFLNLFNTFLKSDKTLIRLNAVRNDKFGALTKYLALNFKPLGGDESCEMMNIQQDKARQAIENFKTKIELIPIDGNDVKLEEILSLD